MRLDYDIEISHRLSRIEQDFDRETQRLLDQTPKRFEGFVRNELMRLIYLTPESPTYRRTWNLYRALKRSGNRIWMDTVKAPYTKYVHNGTRYMKPRRFWDRALRQTLNQVERDLDRIERRYR